MIPVQPFMAHAAIPVFVADLSPLQAHLQNKMVTNLRSDLLIKDPYPHHSKSIDQHCVCKFGGTCFWPPFQKPRPRFHPRGMPKPRQEGAKATGRSPQGGTATTTKALRAWGARQCRQPRGQRAPNGWIRVHGPVLAKRRLQAQVHLRACIFNTDLYIYMYIKADLHFHLQIRAGV